MRDTMTLLIIACLFLTGCGLIPPTPAQVALKTATAQCQQGNGEACRAMGEMVSAWQLSGGAGNAAYPAEGGLWPHRNTVIVATAVNPGIGVIQPIQPQPIMPSTGGIEMTQDLGRPAEAVRS
jgi:hypothetical protein